MKQLTLRKIPARVEKQLRVHARKNGLSLNKSAVSLLSKALGVEEPVCYERKRDLSSFLGTLNQKDLKEFEADTADFAKIDREMWKS
jgi:plasmid stability protein